MLRIIYSGTLSSVPGLQIEEQTGGSRVMLSQLSAEIIRSCEGFYEAVTHCIVTSIKLLWVKVTSFPIDKSYHSLLTRDNDSLPNDLYISLHKTIQTFYHESNMFNVNNLDY